MCVYVCVCARVCLLQPCWHAVPMSSSAVTVPASTAPSSVTRSMTVLTTVMNLAVSTVGTPVVAVCMSSCQNLSSSLPVYPSSSFMLFESFFLFVFLSASIHIWFSVSLPLNLAFVKYFKTRGSLWWPMMTFMLRMMTVFSTQQHRMVKGVGCLVKDLDVCSLSCLLLVPLLSSIFKTPKEFVRCFVSPFLMNDCI